MDNWAVLIEEASNVIWSSIAVQDGFVGSYGISITFEAFRLLSPSQRRRLLLYGE